MLSVSMLAIAVSVLLQCRAAMGIVSTQGVVYRSENTTQAGLTNTVLLGGLFPVHSSGENQASCGALRPSAVQIVEAMVLAINTINNDTSLLPGVTLAFDIRDTCSQINYGLRQSLDYIQSSDTVCSDQTGLGSSAVLGAFLSTISEAAANLFGLFELPQVSYGSSATILSEERFNFFFRTIPSDLFQARALADIVMHFRWNYIIALHSDDLYGLGGIAAFLEELEQNAPGVCVANVISLSGSTQNYEEALDQMSRDPVRNASVVLLFGHMENAVRIFEAIERRVSSDAGFPLQNITWIGSDSWGDNLPDRYRSMARGMLSTVPQSKAIQAFSDYFTALNPLNNTANPWFIEYWEEEFECDLGLSPNLNSCDVDNQAISLLTTNYSQFSLVPLVFDAVYVVAHSIQNLIDSRCPARDLCAEIATNGIVNGTLLRDSMAESSFPSQSQAGTTFSFDSNGDVSGLYSVLNLQTISDNQFTFVTVGSWDSTNYLQIESSSEIEFVGGAEVPVSDCSLPCGVGEVHMPIFNQSMCCFTCQLCPMNSMISDDATGCIHCDVENGTVSNENRTACVDLPTTFLTWSNPWAIVLVTLTTLGLAATIAVIIIFLVFCNHELIKASSRELSAILLVGLLLFYVMPLFFIAKPSASTCAIQRFGVGFCFTIVYSALLVKTNRIYRIFSRNPNSPAKNLPLISPLSQVLITLGFISVQVVIGIIWLAVDIPSTKVIRSIGGIELVCAHVASPVTSIIVFLAYSLVLLILCTYFAFLTRKVPANFNEAKFINAAVYSTCLIWLGFIPVFFATSNLGTIFQTSTVIFGIILSATTALCCLFFTKLILLSSRIRKTKKAESMSQSRSVTQGSNGALHTSTNSTVNNSLQLKHSSVAVVIDKTL